MVDTINSMLEISPEIPFLSGSKVSFLVWDRMPESLESWDWSDGLYCFFQSRGSITEKEFRFGSPLFGIPNSVRHLEFPFYSNMVTSEYTELAKSWKDIIRNEHVLVFVSSEDKNKARLEFAKIYLSDGDINNWEQVSKHFGLIGDEIPALGEFSKFQSLSKTKAPFAYETTPPIKIKNDNQPKISQITPVTAVVSHGTQETILPANESKIDVSSFTSNEAVQETKQIDPQPVSDPAPEKESITNVSSDFGSSTKFSIQLKMMGVISVLFILTVSTIIFFASIFFRTTSELQLRDNNLRMAEIVGSKVKSDVLNAVERGKQIAVTLTSQGIPEDQKNLLLKTFFDADKEFIYLGIYEKKGETLVNKKEVFNEEELKLTSLTEEDFHNVILRNKDAFSDAFTGQSVLINSSPGFQETSFAIALPTTENGQLDNILIMIIKLDKIIGAFEKKGIETTFLVNGSGTVIAHPKEDLVLSATDLSSMQIVKSMLTSDAPTGQSSYIDPELKEPFLGSFKKIGFADTGVVTIVSENKAFEAVYNIQKRNLYIMGIGLCVALIFVFFFSKTITKPILQLLSATLEIAKGNFKIGIKPTTRDEVGLLTEYFIEMGQGLEEREKVKNILGSMIDPVVVKEAMVDLAALKRGSETDITAFFSDVASFSTISEQLKSADLAALLNEYLSAMTLILKEHEGVLDKYIGDAIVGIFSAPVLVLDHQLKAAKASIKMVQKLAELRAYWTKNNLYSKEAQMMDARIGLNSGPAKVGFMGTDALASYTMMGDTVNLAARLEAAGKDYGVNILITDSIYHPVKEEMLTRNVDLVRVKGKNEPVRIHELIGLRSDVSDQLVEATGLYESAFQAYLKQDWNKAIELFKASQKAKGIKDKSCHVLIERCEEYKESSPGSDWDGVFTRMHK